MVVGAIFYIFAPVLAGLFSEDRSNRFSCKGSKNHSISPTFLCSTLVWALHGAGDIKVSNVPTFIGIWGVGYWEYIS